MGWEAGVANRAKSKGTSFETLIVNYLRAHGFNRVYRPATKGGYDTGDINGLYRRDAHRQAILQAKNQKAFKFSEWLNETVAQSKQAEVGGDALPVLIVKRPRIGEANLGETFCVLRLDDLIGLLGEAGYE